MAQSRSENLELEARGKILRRTRRRSATIELLNDGNMGSYKQAIAEFQNGDDINTAILLRRGRRDGTATDSA